MEKRIGNKYLVAWLRYKGIEEREKKIYRGRRVRVLWIYEDTQELRESINEYYKIIEGYIISLREIEGEIRDGRESKSV